MSTPVASIVVPSRRSGCAAVARVGRSARSARRSTPSVKPPDPGETLPTELGTTVASEPGTREVNGDRAAVPARRGVAGAAQRLRRQPGPPSPPGWMTLSFGTGSGSKATPAMPPSAPTATVAAVIMPITLSRLLLKYSSEDFTGGVDGGVCGVLTGHPRRLGAAGSAGAADRRRRRGRRGVAARDPAGTALIPIADLAWRELERTDVPQTMQNDALVSSMFSHSGQKVSTNVERLSSEPSPLAAASTAASSSAACSIIRILMTRAARITKPQIRPSALPNGR